MKKQRTLCSIFQALKLTKTQSWNQEINSNNDHMQMKIQEQRNPEYIKHHNEEYILKKKGERHIPIDDKILVKKKKGLKFWRDVEKEEKEHRYGKAWMCTFSREDQRQWFINNLSLLSTMNMETLFSIRNLSLKEFGYSVGLPFSVDR